jgi:hypothetical protein
MRLYTGVVHAGGTGGTTMDTNTLAALIVLFFVLGVIALVAIASGYQVDSKVEGEDQTTKRKLKLSLAVVPEEVDQGEVIGRAPAARMAPPAEVPYNTPDGCAGE